MPPLNERAWCLVETACANQAHLGICATRLESGSLVLDFGVSTKGSIDAGLVMAEISMAGLGKTQVETGVFCGQPWQWVITETDHPLEACFLSQAAHWSVNLGNYRAMGSGPACLLNRSLDLEQKHGNKERATKAVLVLETHRLPDTEICRKLAEACGIAADQLAILVAPTASPTGRTQIAARSIETALHKLTQLDFDLRCVVRGRGKCPLAPETQDDWIAMGSTNDMVIFGSQVWLELRGVPDENLDQLAQALPSQASPSYGEPFLNILKSSGGFYNIDPGLFAPAEITLTSLESGKVVRAGMVNEGRIAHILGG